jgi:hypothetical protein
MTRFFRLLSIALALTPVISAQKTLPQPDVEGVFYVANLNAGTLEPLEKELAKDFGSVSTRGGSTVPGDRATMRIEAGPTLEFRVKLKKGETPAQYGLFRFEAESGGRVISWARTLTKITWLKGTQLQFKAEKVDESYRFTPLDPLAPGEYCFGGKAAYVYTFGVDAPARTIRSTTSDPTTERIKTLDDLLQKGLINKDDYDKKRAEMVPPAAGGAEARLRQLEDLYKKGLINKEDYDKKRAQILAEM